MKAAEPSGACRGKNDPAGPKDYSGCTLEDLIGAYDDPGDRGDNDSKDDFDPELSATALIPGERLTFESDELEIRGATSRLSKQKSFKVEFNDASGDAAGDWYGMERFQLNNTPTISAVFATSFLSICSRRLTIFPACAASSCMCL